MLADAGAALAGLAEGSNWRPSALVAQGAALLLLDEDEQADEVLASAAACAAEHGSTETQVVALAERALLARKLDDHDKAEELAKEANELVTTSGVEGAPARALEHAATAQTLLATHFSFRESAEQLYVSRNTIKTQAIPVYRKLGVSSRSDAIAEARRLGLSEHLRVLVSDKE